MSDIKRSENYHPSGADLESLGAYRREDAFRFLLVIYPSDCVVFGVVALVRFLIVAYKTRSTFLRRNNNVVALLMHTYCRNSSILPSYLLYVLLSFFPQHNDSSLLYQLLHQPLRCLDSILRLVD